MFARYASAIPIGGLVNGVPQVATGIEYRFRFDMNDS
jgi:hypothetical protein